MERILHCIIGNMDKGGISTTLMSVYRNIDKTKYQFDFLTHSKNDYYKEEIERLGGKLYYVDFKSKRPIKFWKKFKKILQENNSYKIIHIHTSYALMYFDAKMIKKYTDSKVIVHSHTSNGNGKKQIYINKVLKNKLDKLADYRIAVSESSGEWLFSESSSKKGLIKILNNSIDLDSYYYDFNIKKNMIKNYNLEGKVILGITARLDKVKNIPFILDVFYILKNKYDGFKLFIVGDGGEKERLENIIIEKNLEDDVFITGMVDNINDYLNLFDVFLFPSLHEGLGLSVVEALATGLKCIIHEKLPKELDINDNIVRLPLDVNLWVENIILNKDYIRTNRREDILKSNFDSKNNAMEWERYYDSIIKI